MIKCHFIEGTYRLKHFLFFLIRPTIILKKNIKGNKVTGELKVLHKRYKLSLVKIKEDQLVFQLKIDIIDVDLVLFFYKENSFDGLLDTPIGHIRFTGIQIKD